MNETINNKNKIDQINNNIIKTLTFIKVEPLYALISGKNEIQKIGNIIDMIRLSDQYNSSFLDIFKEHKPFKVIKIDKEKSFIKEANH